MRVFPTGLLLLLASCVAPVPGPYGSVPGTPAAYQPQPILVAAPAMSVGRSVEYAGTGDGSLLSVRLTALPGGRTRADGGTQGNGTACAGSFSGDGIFRGNRLVV